MSEWEIERDQPSQLTHNHRTYRSYHEETWGDIFEHAESAVYANCDKDTAGT
jgi:hypothetical protein